MTIIRGATTIDKDSKQEIIASVSDMLAEIFSVNALKKEVIKGFLFSLTQDIHSYHPARAARECGYDYAYTFPGMNNILQAAGRVIRTDSDKGIVILVDDRYGEAKYKFLFPPQWSHMIYTGDPASLSQAVSNFWNKEKNKK